ncbi:hypothetical protein EYC80_009083 [Monilinia laxa]|uniref:Uncharacterized protein n=1 Tax=Monilinia laxa TaxID=61186 RepID=A0A5N6K2F7_MONLA|nr:hypothetical protein EYC80_009083 [Monilinia laxa]
MTSKKSFGGGYRRGIVSVLAEGLGLGLFRSIGVLVYAGPFKKSFIFVNGSSFDNVMGLIECAFSPGKDQNISSYKRNMLMEKIENNALMRDGREEERKRGGAEERKRESSDD